MGECSREENIAYFKHLKQECEEFLVKLIAVPKYIETYGNYVGEKEKTLYWQMTMDNLFYLLNFSYIGISISLGIFLFTRKYKHARRVTQLLVGLYMLVYLGLISNENMQIEGFWYYLFTGVFEAAAIHYAVAALFTIPSLCSNS